MGRLSLKAIGEALGVSAMSVSLAIRGRPGVSDELRQRVLAYTRERRYVPDPVAAELMSLVRARRQRKAGEVIAFINTFSDPLFMNRVPGLSDFLTGAQQRAAVFGYRVEEFRARSKGMSGARLSKILKSRGVRGVLVGPRWRLEPDIEFEWSAFSVVLVGEAEYGPNIYRVSNHHVHTCCTCLRQMAARGYHRIGVYLVRSDEELRGHDYSLGVDQYRRGGEGLADVVVELVDDFEPRQFRRWVQDHRLDAVISLAVQPWEVVSQLRTTEGQPVGYANLNVLPGINWSGMNQHSDQVGAAAVDLLRSLLHGGERGAAPAPRILLIDGSWVDGITARGLPAAPASP